MILLSLYVPETIVPVTGMASCRSVFVDVISLFKNVLNVVAISYSFYTFFTNRTGISILYPVVAPVTLIVVSIYLKLIEAPLLSTIVSPLAPNCSNKYVLVAKSVDALTLNAIPEPKGPRICEVDLVPSVPAVAPTTAGSLVDK